MLNRFLFLVAVSLIGVSGSKAAIFVVSGIYQGKNLFIDNPSTGKENEFCTNDVYVNDTKVMSGITAGAFEIDLSTHRINEQITIKITHKEGCKPRVLNPQVIKPASSFHFNSFQVDQQHIVWSTRGEKGAKGKYLIEIYQNNAWVLVKEVPAKGSMFLNNYDETRVQKGASKYRLKYVELDGRVHYSQIVETLQ